MCNDTWPVGDNRLVVIVNIIIQFKNQIRSIEIYEKKN